MNTIKVVNMTEFFSRQLMLYSLGDLRFRKPKSLKKAGWTIALLALYSTPMLLFSGISLNVFTALIILGPPFVVGHYATKPIFAGKTLLQFITTMIRYSLEPKAWADLYADTKDMGNKIYTVMHEVWISRRRELTMLADIKEGRH